MSVYKPKNTPYYHYDFQRSGRRFHGSTGCTSRREAETFERLEKVKATRQIEDAKSVNLTSISHAFARFWEEKGQYDSEADTTFDRMETLQDILSDLMADRGRAADLEGIDAEVLAAFVARRQVGVSRSGRPLSNASINREVQILRRIMRRALRVWRLAIHLPAWDEILLPEADEHVVDISRETETALIQALREDYRAAAQWLIMSGLRLSNGLPLHPSAVDFELGILTVKQKSKRPGGKLHILPITRAMKILLANNIGHHPDAVFTYISRGKKTRVKGERYPIQPETFYNEFKAAAAAIGRPELRPHDLRHVAGTRTLRASGGNLRAAQKHLGHSRISTTTKYAHYMVDELRAAMEAAHTPEENPETAPLNNDSALLKLGNMKAGKRS